ncbi:MAG: GNAT family N-acetyltransferase [Myxacorys chilensis ATA2-1-KO14]|jgi:ribosomal protein S18 acetylase RimI-like enzyme|nr:GNAT family N-acetyltransferase [Myxacorys chilensis ATA2-1-KO14]
MPKGITFTTIDLARHADLCVCFRRDSYECSFLNGAQRFDQENGKDGKEYLDWLQKQIAELPEGCVHVLEDGHIVGQVEMRLREQPRLGYVNLFYLIPEARGGGIGDELNQYAIKVFKKLEVSKAQLSVSPSNHRAIAYYRKHGWVDLGPRPGHPEVHLMEITIPCAT